MQSRLSSWKLQSTVSIGGSSSPWISDTNGISYIAGNVGIDSASHATYSLRVGGSTLINTLLYVGDVIATYTDPTHYITIAGENTLEWGALQLGGRILTTDSIAGEITFFNDASTAEINAAIRGRTMATGDSDRMDLEFWTSNATPTLSKVMTIAYNQEVIVHGSFSLASGATVDNIETTLTNDDTHLPTSGAVYDAIDALPTWGTATNDYIVYGSASGDIESQSDFYLNDAGTSKNLRLNASTASRLQLQVGGTTIFQLGGTATAPVINANASILSVYASGTNPRMTLGLTADGDSWLTIRDYDSSTPYTNTLNVLDSAASSIFRIEEAGSVYMTELSSDDTEDHVIGIDDTTGLLTKRSVQSIQRKTTQISASLTDGAPTDAEIDSATGLTPATAGAGYKVTIKDSDGSGSLYYVESDGTNWFYYELTQAT